MQKVVPQNAVLIPDAAQLVFQGEIFGVYQWDQALFDGSRATFEMLKRPDTTTAICIVDDKLIVLDEEQPNSGKRRSFPGGRVEPEDDSIQFAAEREVQEETGYSFQNWRLLKVAQPIKKMEWFIYVWLAWEPTGRQATAHDPGEKIVVEHLAFDEVKTLVSQREGIMDEAFEVFESVQSVEELMDTPEYTGKILKHS